MTRPRLRLAVYWASACGGCEVALLNLGERLLELEELFELAFCPCLADFKREDLERTPDGHIDLCLFDGAIRNTENREMAALLRRKSRLLVAFGSCAHDGCIPALANLSSAASLLECVYPEGTAPRARSTVPEGELTLPALLDAVLRLEDVERVDYTIPGCPPEPRTLWSALSLLAGALRRGNGLPPPGSVLGAGSTSVCEECPLPRSERRTPAFHRPHEKRPEPSACLLEQGFVCSGPATRDGCGALCPRVGMGCRGCYGAPEGVRDQGARMIGALAAVLDAPPPVPSGPILDERARTALLGVVDPAGTLYRHGLAAALLPPRPGTRALTSSPDAPRHD